MAFMAVIGNQYSLFNRHAGYDDRQTSLDDAQYVAICIGKCGAILAGDSVLQKRVGKHQRRTGEYGCIGYARHSCHLSVFRFYDVPPTRYGRTSSYCPCLF